MVKKKIKDIPTTGFALSCAETPTTIHIHKMPAGDFSIRLETSIPGHKSFSTGMQLVPETFYLLSLALFKAAHEPGAFKPLEKAKE